MQYLLGGVNVPSLTVPAMREITELRLCHIPDRASVPEGPGVYVWAADDVSAGIEYIGSGSGWNGLWSRLGTWFAGIETVRSAVRSLGDDPLAEGGVAWASPAVRIAALKNLRCYASVTGEEPGAKVWEARMQQANRIVSGRTAPLGGSAWELKGDLAKDADRWAFDRLRSLYGRL